MPKKIVNMKLPPDEHFPYGGYYLTRLMSDGQVKAVTVMRCYSCNDWMFAQRLKKARHDLAMWPEQNC